MKAVDILNNNNSVLLSEQDPERRAGIVTFARPGIDTARLYEYLQKSGVVCALRAGGIRFSPHFYTTRQTLDRALALSLEYKH